MGEDIPLPSPSEGYDVIASWNPAHIITESQNSNDYALLILNVPINNVELLKLVWKKGGVVVELCRSTVLTCE